MSTKSHESFGVVIRVLIARYVFISIMSVQVLAGEEPTDGEEEDQMDFATFTAPETWANDYSMCNPEKNKYLSTINIDTKAALPTKEKTLFVHSDSPPQRLYRLLYYRNDSSTHNNITLAVDALNINIGKDDSRLHEATFVSGLGDDAYKFFRNAFILFGKKDVDLGPKRSFHQVNGQKFEMEIVLNFVGPPRSPTSPADVTQIHIMVNATTEDNPVFHPIIAAIPSLKTSFTSVEESSFEYNKVKGPANIVAEEIQQFEKKEEQETTVIKDGVEVGIATYAFRAMEKEKEIEFIGNAEEDYTVFKTELAEAEKLLTSVKLDLSKLQREKDNMELEKETAEREYMEKVERGELINGEVDETKEKADSLREEIKEMTAKLNSFTRRFNEQSVNRDQKEIMMNNAKSKLEKFGWTEKSNIKNEGTDYMFMVERKVKLAYYKNQTLLKKQLKKKAAEFNAILTKIGTSLGETLMDEPFQISWLLPSKGGYYAYNGSSPVAPCKKRTFVIVMKNHINISHHQLEVFRSSFNESVVINKIPHDPLDITVPLIHPLGDRKIWYNPKNLQFVKDDGFHMLSSLRRKIKMDHIIKTTTSASVITIYIPLLAFTFLITIKFAN